MYKEVKQNTLLLCIIFIYFYSKDEKKARIEKVLLLQNIMLILI